MTPPDSTDPCYFESPDAFRRWLRKNHRAADEIIVGYYKKHTGRPTLTWPESVAEALCFGWIDGIRRSVDADRYTIRFTPRRPRSNWSAVNIRMYAELEAAGRMTKAGRAAFEARVEARSEVYTYEQPPVELDAARAKAFRRNKAAWTFFEAQPPGYRRTMIGWIMSAKKDETKDRRLNRLIELSAAGKRFM